jgi:5-methylcytosine-specific restriction endonuclease McrA
MKGIGNRVMERSSDQDPGSQGDPSPDPENDVDKISQDGSGKRTWTQNIPELARKSKQIRHEAAQKRECASCEKPLAGSQVYYCSEDCKLEFYQSHPTSVRWNDLRLEALKRDNNRCVKCSKPAEEVDHIQEIWEDGPEFDLANLQSLCQECHVQKTNESRRRRDEQEAEELKQ